MAQQQQATDATAVQALVKEVARKCAIWLDGAEEPLAKMSFDAIEQYGVQVGDAVARGIMEQALESQAANTPADVCCCGNELASRQPDSQVLLTRRGEVAWDQPKGHCPRCRRDFFPSVPNAGAASR